jgi:hypothetical protein
MTQTIDLTPTWQGILPALLAIFEHGDRKTALEELLKMAKIADHHISLINEGKIHAD